MTVCAAAEAAGATVTAPPTPIIPAAVGFTGGLVTEWPAMWLSSSNGAALAPFFGLAMVRPGGSGGGIDDWKEGIPAGSSSLTANETDSLNELESAWAPGGEASAGVLPSNSRRCSAWMGLGIAEKGQSHGKKRFNRAMQDLRFA